jgi:hypothetical protein
MADHDTVGHGSGTAGGAGAPGGAGTPAGPGQGPFDREINVRAVVLFGVALALSVIASMILMWFMFRYFDRRADDLAERTVSPLVAPGERRLPPEPRLQAQPPVEMIALRAAEDSVLTGYGWVDEQAGIVRIPVDAAMDLVAERRLVPSTPTPAGSTPRRWQLLEAARPVTRPDAQRETETPSHGDGQHH